MNNRRNSSKSGLFLMELIIAIAFFAAASAICIQLFAKAHMLSSTSNNLNMALSVAQSAGEAFKATPTIKGVGEIIGAETDEEGLSIFYNSAWDKIEKGDLDIRFVLSLQMIGEDEKMPRAQISVTDVLDERAPIYIFTVSKFVGAG